jgi:hypothetical protein
MKITIELELALAVTFITLKLCGVISWSWGLVLLPLYFTTALALTFVLIGLFFHILIMILEYADSKLNHK